MTATKTTVVHWQEEESDIYIGRGQDSKWGNPFSHLKHSAAEFPADDRAHAIALYDVWIRKQPELMAALPELKGKRLGCWCAPLACHGDVLARLADKT